VVAEIAVDLPRPRRVTDQSVIQVRARILEALGAAG
jgi:hypothetical protein